MTHRIIYTSPHWRAAKCYAPGLPGLLVFLVVAIFAPDASAQRIDNRRLVWTGSHGAEWSGSSWKTTDSYLSRLNTTEAQWTGPISGLAEPSLAFLAGDSVIFDSTGDVPASRAVNIDGAGVTVSDVVVSGGGNYTFTGGAITADGGALTLTTYQLAGSGIVPGGRLVKTGSGALTLSNTAANTFKGGIVLAQGTIEVADARALGNNNIIITATGGRLAGASADAIPTYLTPAVVTDAAGTILCSPTYLASGTRFFAPGMHLDVPASAAGLDITGDILFDSGALAAVGATLTLDIDGDTTISGRVSGGMGAYYPTAGAIVKTGAGTLTLTSADNWIGGSGTLPTLGLVGTIIVAEGRLVATDAGALGPGDIAIAPAATLAIKDVRGATYHQLFTGGGTLEIVNSDISLDWRTFRGGVSLVGATATNNLGRLHVTGASRLTALASGTLSGVLGGPAVAITVSDHSSLVVGREGVTHRTVGTPPPLAHPINAGGIAVTDGSTLVLQPNAWLKVGGAVTFDAGSKLTFAGGGVSRLDYVTGTPPAPADTLVPAGMTLERHLDPDAGRLDYIVVNQGANPLKDIVMTLASIDAVMDTVSSRLDEDFLAPVADADAIVPRPWRHSAWLRYFSSAFDQDADTAFAPGWDGRLGGLLAGFDSVLRRRLALGLYTGYSETDLTTTNDTGLRAKHRFLGLHAAQRFGWFHAGLHLARVTAHTDSWRQEPTGLTRGRWGHKGFTGGGELGATLAPWKSGFLKDTFLKPSLGLRHTELDLYGFDERGVSPMDIPDFSDTLTRFTAALQAGQRFKLLGRPAAALLSFASHHALHSPRDSLAASYLGDPDRHAFTLQGGDYYGDTVAAGLSLRVLLPRNLQAGLNLERETGSGRTRDTLGLLLGVAW